MRDFYVNFAERGPVHEDLDNRDLEILDTVTPTSINEFIKIFADDRTFAPPEAQMVFDSDLGDIDIDSDVAPDMTYDFEEALEDDEKTRARD